MRMRGTKGRSESQAGGISKRLTCELLGGSFVRLLCRLKWSNEGRQRERADETAGVMCEGFVREQTSSECR